MDKHRKVSLVVLFGNPLFFLVLSHITGRWAFFLISLPPCFLAGFTGFIVSK
jgi:hypothetical protein